MNMQVVIPMTGSGQRFLSAGYALPKPLIPVDEKPIIEHLVAKFPRHWKFVFICNSEHLKSTPLRSVLEGLGVPHEIVEIDPHKLGPVHAVLQAAHAIDDRLPTLVNYCDFSFSWDPDGFSAFTERTRCDGAVLCYRGFHPHYLNPTMYAYCRESKGRVLEVREKACFTDNRENEYASSGSYYFRSGKLAKDYFRKAKDSGVTVNGEFYVSLVYNPMIADGLDVRVYEIPFFLQWGTPQDLEDYQYWHRLFHRMARETVPSKPDSTPLLMPMAGGGERFRKAGYPSKPLCPVMGKPMFLAAVEHLPCDSSRPVLVTQPDVAEEVRRAHPGAELVVLDGPTQGQADTCRKALGKLDLEKPVLISSCDHGLVWDREKWNGIVSSGADVVIVGQRGVPDVRRKPASYAYLRLGPDGVRIAEVSVKKPISPQPQRDPILVGTFYFRKARFMADAVQKLIERDVRVNGELYLDSAVNLCIEAGLDVRCFEADGYLCWGSPEALREFNYWYRYFLGVSS